MGMFDRSQSKHRFLVYADLNIIFGAGEASGGVQRL